LRLAALVVIFVLTYLLLLRPVKKQLLRSLGAGTVQETAALEPHAGAQPQALPEGEGAGGEQERPAIGRLMQEVSERVQREPATASRLVQGWIRNGENS